MDWRRVRKITSITGRVAGLMVIVVLLGIYAFFSSLNSHDTIWQQPFFFLSISLVLGISVGWLMSRRVLGALQWTLCGLLIYVLFFRNMGLDWATWTPRSAEDKTRFEIAGPTVDDRMFDIKANSANVLLVDFWATWCAPCRAQLHHIKNAYQKYHAQGLDVVGISSDSSKEALSQFIEDNKMPWPQIIFDEQLDDQSWSPLAKKYGINAIPRVLLLDPKSQMVIASAENGAQLDSVIAGTLKSLADKNLAPDLIEKKKLVFVPVGPYLAALLAALISALIDRRKGQRPALKLVRSQV